MYTLQQFRDLVREHLELDVTDLSDALVGEFLLDAAQHCQYARTSWPFYDQIWTFTTVIGDSDYLKADLATNDPDGHTIAEIVRIRGDGRELQVQSARSYERNNPVGSVSTGEPMFWSEWGSVITLDPQPTAEEALTLRGWRNPTDWVTPGVAGDESDMPAEFDRVILNWALGRAYGQQEQADTSVYYLDLAEVQLRQLVRSYDEPSPSEHLIMGGGVRQYIRPDLPLDFE